MSEGRNTRPPNEEGGLAENEAVYFSGLRHLRPVNLSHSISTSAPHWPGDPPVEFNEWSEIPRHGFFLRRFSMGEHCATHLTAPASFYSHGLTVDNIPAEQLVAPAVAIDVRAKCQSNPDYALTIDELLDWESRHGQVPSACLALLLTGWSEHWDNPSAYLGEDAGGNLHFPGFGLEAADLLIQERRVAGLGTDTAGVEPGADSEFYVSRLALSQSGIVLQNLANLDQLPPTGSVLVIGVLRLVGGSGSPAGVTALLPPRNN